MARQKTEKEKGELMEEEAVHPEKTETGEVDDSETQVMDSCEVDEIDGDAEERDLNEFSEMSQALEKAQSDLVDAKEQVLRACADAQNAKRRAQIDVEKARKYALEKFVESLLPVIDSLERGLGTESSGESAEAMKEGMELTLKLFLDTMKRFNVEQVSPEGEPFDPALHQAMSQIEAPDAEPGTVINVFQKGYVLNGRLVRPAMVIVAK